MANEHIDPNSIQHPDHPEHHTWLQSLMEKVHNLDTEFPLSGGETNEDLDRVTHAHGDAFGEEHKTGEHKEHHSIMENLMDKIYNLDTEFPLSGGETDEDFDRATHVDEEKDTPDDVTTK